jgi:hypothetical protein
MFILCGARSEVSIKPPPRHRQELSGGVYILWSSPGGVNLSLRHVIGNKMQVAFLLFGARSEVSIKPPPRQCQELAGGLCFVWSSLGGVT